jgi:succinyl-diaminopimelate desuccinylase
MNDLTSTLIELVDTPSVVGSEGRLCTAIAERLLPQWGLDGVRRIGNALVVGKRTGRPQITLYGHIDTVPSQGQGAARIEAGRLYGLGASDMKAGVAVMIHLLEDAAVRGGPYDVIGVFYDREEGPAAENGLIDVLETAGWLDEAAFAIVLEPTDLELQLGCQGVINATVVFDGKAAHSARPWLGENAVTKAGAWLASMHNRPVTPVLVGGLEFREVMTVTGAEGGVARNIIPARFEINLNYRFPPSMGTSEAEQVVRAAAADADAVNLVDVAPAAPLPTGNVHYERLAAITEAPVTPKQAWTDVSRLTERGISALNYGPGETAQAHQLTESVPVDNLEVIYRALHNFLTS